MNIDELMDSFGQENDDFFECISSRLFKNRNTDDIKELLFEEALQIPEEFSTTFNDMHGME